MPTEQRVIASKSTIGSRTSAGTAAADPGPADTAAAKKKRTMLVVVVLLLLAGGAGYWFLMGPGAATGHAEEAEEEHAAEPGEVLAVEPVSVNLADGHYLRIGLGLQLTADLHEPVDPARALDATIALFSGRPVEEVASAEGRAALKAELAHQLQEAYHGEVIDVYLTDYVTQ